MTAHKRRGSNNCRAPETRITLAGSTLPPCRRKPFQGAGANRFVPTSRWRQLRGLVHTDRRYSSLASARDTAAGPNRVNRRAEDENEDVRGGGVDEPGGLRRRRCFRAGELV